MLEFLKAKGHSAQTAAMTEQERRIFEETIKLARAGELRAQEWLANHYAKLSKPEETLEWARKAARQGSARAAYLMGFYLRHGIGVKADLALALSYLREAVGEGDANAKYELACMLENAQGVARDVSTAAMLYLQAAEAGIPRAQYKVATLYAGAKEHHKAFTWMDSAAQAGIPAALTHLGDYYALGIGCEQDRARSLELYRLAAQKNDPDGQAKLGYAYIQGEGVCLDLSQAEYWLEKSARQGSHWGLLFLGMLHVRQGGETMNRKRVIDGINLLKRAAASGNPFAQLELDQLR